MVLIDIFRRIATGKEVFFYHVRSAGDLFDTAREPVNLDAVLKDVWEAMTAVGLTSLPVVELEAGGAHKSDKPRPTIGVVRKSELATLFSRFVGALSQPASDDRALKVRLSNANITERGLPPVTKQMSILEVITVMVDAKVEALPVVDEGRNYLGMITSLDVLKCFDYLNIIRASRPKEELREMRIVDLFVGQGSAMPTDKMLESFVGSVKEVMRESVPTIALTASIGEAARLMNRTERETIVVIDPNGTVKGIVTALEIQLALPPIVNRMELRAAKERAEMFKMNPESSDVRAVLAEKVTQVMLANPTCVTTDTPVGEVVARQTQIDAYEQPVLSSDKTRIAGVIGRSDLLRALAALGGLAKKRGLIDE
jgi:CBS-domain-containing membrane protein